MIALILVSCLNAVSLPKKLFGLNVFLNFNEQKFGCFLERKPILSCSKYTQRTL